MSIHSNVGYWSSSRSVDDSLDGVLSMNEIKAGAMTKHPADYV